MKQVTSQLIRLVVEINYIVAKITTKTHTHTARRKAKNERRESLLRAHGNEKEKIY